MESPKKVSKSAVPKKKAGIDPDNHKNSLTDPNDPMLPNLDDEDDFDLPLDDDIATFDNFDDDDDDDF